MEPPLPSVMYLPGKIQERHTAPSILTALPPPEVNMVFPKVLCEEPALPEVIDIGGSLPNVIHLPDIISLLQILRLKIIAVLLILLICITYLCFEYSAITSLLFDQSPSKNVLLYLENEILESEIECYLSSDSDYNKIDENTSHDLNKLTSEGYKAILSKYKYVFIGVGLIGFYLAF